MSIEKIYKQYNRGEIYSADLDPCIGSEQGGLRPVVILQNNAGNWFSPTLIVAPATSKIQKKTNLPTHVKVESSCGLKRSSIFLLEQIRVIDKKRIRQYIGKISREQLFQIERALCASLNLGFLPDDQNLDVI